MSASSRAKGRPSTHFLPSFEKYFKEEHLLKKPKSNEQRMRSFSPRSFFEAMVHLVSGTNEEGYYHALSKTFSLKDLPSKSAFSKARKRISSKFFSSVFLKLISDFQPHRASYQGLKIYAIDGFELLLPRTKELLKKGFRGRAVGSYMDTYMLHLYSVHAYDVLSGVTRSITYSTGLDEISDAKSIVQTLEESCLCLYDRLYLSTPMILAHKQAHSFFLMRAKRESFRQVESYYQSKRQKPKSVTICGVKLRLFKAVNPRTGKKDVFVTNLPWPWLHSNLIQRLYQLRWEVENSFRDLIRTLKVEQWHSKSLNGILQELFTLLWLNAFAKIQIALKSKKPKITLSDQYEKPNFKLILDYLKTNMKQLLSKKITLLRALRKLIKISTEKRVHYKRSYPRQLRRPQTGYHFNNLVFVWES